MKKFEAQALPKYLLVAALTTQRYGETYIHVDALRQLPGLEIATRWIRSGEPHIDLHFRIGPYPGSWAKGNNRYRVAIKGSSGQIIKEAVLRSLLEARGEIINK